MFQFWFKILGTEHGWISFGLAPMIILVIFLFALKHLIYKDFLFVLHIYSRSWVL